MKILVTGSNGFIGKNLVQLLEKKTGINEIIKYNRNNSFEELEEFCMKADVVFHLAAVLRPENISGFDDNIDLTSRLLMYLRKANNKSPVMFASSIQADLNNPYGDCKRTEEEKLIAFGVKNKSNVYIFRFPNLFGAMSRPNYTSVIATFCYNTVRGIPIVVNDPSVVIKFAFIENVLEDVMSMVMFNKSEYANKILSIENYYSVGLGELAYYMGTLKRDVNPLIIRDDDFYSHLKRTYMWYKSNAKLFEK